MALGRMYHEAADERGIGAIYLFVCLPSLYFSLSLVLRLSAFLVDSSVGGPKEVQEDSVDRAYAPQPQAGGKRSQPDNRPRLRAF